MLNLARVRLLVELERLGTVAAVADALDYTPSAVSQQLAQLERETPRPLLEKVGRRLRPTDAGRLLAAHGRELIARAEAAESELSAMTGLAGTLRTAAFETAARELVTPAMIDLAERHPELGCELLDLEAEEALPLLQAAQLDVVIAEEYEHAPRPRLPGVERHELLEDALLVALHPEHPLAVRGGSREDRGAQGRAVGGAAPEHRLCGHARTGLPRRGALRAGLPPPGERHADDPRAGGGGPRGGTRPHARAPGATPRRRRAPLAGKGLSRSIFASVRSGAGERPSVKALLGAMRAARPEAPSN